MKTQLKRLLALNLALIMLFCAALPASAGTAAAQPAAAAQPQAASANPGTHTLTIDGKTYTIDTETVVGNGWEARALLNGDNAPLFVLTLNDYNGGPIKISDPTGIETAEQVYALVSISGTNAVTAQSGAGITAEGYAALTIERGSRTGALTVSGQPAVRTDGRLQIFSGGTTLDGGTGAAYEAQNGFSYDDRRCEANETKTGDLVTKLVMRDIAHYLDIDGQRYYLSERYPSVSSSGWSALLTQNGDGLPTLCVELNGYTRGAISFSAPYNAGETADALAILNYTGQNAITNEAGPAVRAIGYSWLTLQERENGSSLTVSGTPAVRTDKELTLRGRNITLDGLNGPAYSAASFGYDGSLCSVNEEWRDGVVVRVTTSESTRVTITVYSDAEKTQTVTRTVNQYGLVDLTNLFTQANKYVRYYQAENGECYGALFNADRDLELTAVWEDCDAAVPAVFYVNGTNFTEAKVVDAAANGWKAPEQTGYTNEYGQTLVTYEFLCWERKTENGYTYLLSGQEQTALTAGVGYYGRYTSRTTGIVFYANGEAFPNGMAVIEDSNACQTMRQNSQSGKVLTGWNTKPDGTGTSYAADGAEVPQARTSLVRLYAQWADPENSVCVRFHAGATGYDEEKWFPRGSQIELPELGEMFGQAQPYWDMQFFCADGSDGRMDQLQSGAAITLPADAVNCWLNAYWIPTAPLVIGGQRHTFTRNRTSFSGSGDSGDRWTVTYNTYAGYLNVWLVDYQGPEISLPASAVLTLVESAENTITAEAGNSAISCRGWLSLCTECSDGKHPSLVASASAGAPVITADRVMARRAPHVELIAGEGSTVFAGGTPLELDACACSFSGVRSGETDTVTLDPDTMSAALSRLLIHPQIYMLSVNGGGSAKTPDGKTTDSKPVEAGQTTSYSAFGFTYPGHWCIGYSPSNVVFGNNYEVSIPNGDCTIELHWTETGYDSFLAFRSDYTLADESEWKHSYKSNQNTVLFENYASGFATAPDLTFVNASSCGDLLYWYTEAGKMYETDDSQQFLPNEQINAMETRIQSGTTLHAVADGEYSRIIYANGKLFADGSKYGKKVITWDWNYAISMRATDGSELLSWNTQPDGTGTTYMRGELVPRDVKKLYAQWLETGSVKVTMRGYTTSGETVCVATPGTDFTLPQPAEMAAGLRFMQWRCIYIDQDYKVHEIGMRDAGSLLRITEDMKDLHLYANWLPTGELIVDGQNYTFDETNTFFSERRWSAEFVTWEGEFRIYLYGYQGGSISIPCAAQVGVRDGENRIDGTLSCAGTLDLFTSCEYGAHSSLTITAAEADKPAILANELILERIPHMTLTGGANSKAIASMNGSWNPSIYADATYYYGKTGSEAQESFVPADEVDKIFDMRQLRTEPVMCSVTIYGGGATANGDASITRELEYGERYSLGSAGFKKQHAELIGTEETGNGKFGYWSDRYPLDIVPCAKTVTLHLRWKEIGYAYIAFRGEDVLEGDGVPENSNVVYYHNSPTLTVPKLVYQDAVSAGDLLYWYTSESGEETADSHCYLPGETVQEPDDTTLYAASSQADVLVLVATGTTFMGWNRIYQSSVCIFRFAADGRVVESWNTKPDGSGTRYEIGTPIDKVNASTRVLYAQWKPAFLATAAMDSATGKTLLTIKPSSSLIGLPENTDDQPFAESVRIMLAAYQDGRFAGMVFAEAKNGEITCRLPDGLDYRKCELKLFFLKNGKPSRAAGTIRIES